MVDTPCATVKRVESKKKYRLLARMFVIHMQSKGQTRVQAVGRAVTSNC